MKKHLVLLNLLSTQLPQLKKSEYEFPENFEGDLSEYRGGDFPEFALDISNRDGEVVIVSIFPIATMANKAEGLELIKQKAEELGLTGEGLTYGYVPWTTSSKINNIMMRKVHHSCYALDVKDPNPAEVSHTCILDRSGYFRGKRDNSVVMPNVYFAVYMSQAEFERRFPNVDISDHIWYGAFNVFDI